MMSEKENKIEENSPVLESCFITNDTCKSDGKENHSCAINNEVSRRV